MATVKHKALATATIAGVNLSVVAVPSGPSRSVETDSLAAWGDQTPTQIPRGLTTLGDLTLQCLYEGVAPSVKAGDIVSLTVTPTYSDGSAETAPGAWTESVVVKSLTYPEVEVNGSHEVRLQLVLAPVGGYDITPAG